MSGQIQCRQCGAILERTDFPTGDFKCPDCGWTQLLSHSGRFRLKKKQKEERMAALAMAEAEAEAKAASEAADDEEQSAEALPSDPSDEAAVSPEHLPGQAPAALAPLPVLELEDLRALTPADFAAWCRALLSRFGYVLGGKPVDGARARHLELVRGGERILVDCIAYSERENVGRPEGQNLIAAMERRKIHRGMLFSPGSFENGCRTLAERSSARIELIDGERLELTASEIATGPLSDWWT